MTTHVSIIILGLVFLLIAVRQVGRFRFRIWQVMTAGAVAVILTGEITPVDALQAVNPEVMCFLFGMFVVGEAVSASGFLTLIADRICSMAHTPDHLLLILIIVLAIASAFIMNDTVAIIGTPLVLSLAYRFHLSPHALLLVLCFALTTGSVVSPIGNPQNLLIATYWNPDDPFLAFACGLLIPTVLSLGLIFLLMRRRCQQDDHEVYIVDLPACPDRRLKLMTALSLLILLILIVIRITGAYLGDFTPVPLGLMALLSALPIVVFTRQRGDILRAVDWKTLLFFVSMFILMQAVYNSGWFQAALPLYQVTSIPLILALSILISQFISNVPFVALFQPVIASSSLTTEGMLALAAGSTIAGNLTILGAASNVIVVQQAEKFGVHITFWDFCSVGVPLTLLQAGVYALFLGYL